MGQQIRQWVMVLCTAVVLTLAFASPALADASKDQTCTNFQDLGKTALKNVKAKNASLSGSGSGGSGTATEGLLTSVTKYIKGVVNSASKELYEAFTKSTVYQNAVTAAMTLMVIFYGVGFLIGVVQASFGQILIRLVKMGIVFAMISPTGWQFFSDYAVKFFNDGTDDIIAKVMSIGTGDPFVVGESPFKHLDALASIVISPDMIINMMGALTSGPYGLMMGGLIGFAIWGLMMMLLDGLKIYAISFVVRSLLLGIAPIFIIFLLFERTKQMFTGWLNVLVFLSLQPILFFTFISFFLVMMMSATTNMMGDVEVCWTEFTAATGTDNKVSGWRYKVDGKYATPETFTWQGSVSCRLNAKTPEDAKNCDSFPVNVVDLLTFLILVYVAKKFSGVVGHVASEISNSFVQLDRNTKMDLGMLKRSEERSAQVNAGGAR